MTAPAPALRFFFEKQDRAAYDTVEYSFVYEYLKGKSSLMIFERHANLKYKYGNRRFWCKGYYVDTAGRNEKKTAEYVRNQLQEDQITDQIGLQEYFDPFTGEPEKRQKMSRFSGGP